MRSPSPLATSLILLLAGCGHTIHPAAVQPGFSLEALAGLARVRHEPLPTRPSNTPGVTVGNKYIEPPGEFDPYSSGRPAVQLAMGYGWRFSDNSGTQLQLAVGNLTVPTLDGYVQLMGKPVDAGVGVIVMLGSVGTYGMVGKGLPLGQRTELRFDAGFRLLKVVVDYDVWSWGPMALISIRHRGLSAGIWIDNLLHDQVTYDQYCDETCKPNDFTRRRVAGGLYLRRGTDALGGRR